MLLFFRLTYVCKYRDIIELSNSFKKKIKILFLQFTENISIGDQF